MSNHFTLPNNPLDWPAGAKDFTGVNNLGLHTKETIQRYVYGTRYITWDGRVFKYMGLTTGGCVSYHGVASTAAAVLAYTANPVAAAAGDMSITATIADLAEDQLAGGFVALYRATIDNSTVRAIVGNDASGASTTKIYLEAPLAAAHAITTDYHEIFANPYRLVSETSNAYAAWMGVPCVTAATTYNVWVQTWGPAFISPGNLTLDDPAADERSVYWKTDAVLSEAAVTGATSESQHAGYILNSGGSGIAGPMIYLMCST